jgi:hypothetical protein
VTLCARDLIHKSPAEFIDADSKDISERHAGVSICARARVTLEVQQLLPFCFVVGQTSK